MTGDALKMLKRMLWLLLAEVKKQRVRPKC